MDFLFIADPLDRIRPQGDSTLALVRETLRRGDRAFWALAEAVEYHVGEVRVRAAQCLECPDDALPRLSGESELNLTSFRAVFIRKDPPFDTSYQRLCWVLQLVEDKVTLVNRPSLLLRYHEKMMALETLAQGYLQPEQVVPTLIAPPALAHRQAREEGWGTIVVKPLLGFGGQRVRLVALDQLDALSNPEEEMVYQPFLEEVRHLGDRRVFFLNGELLGHFVRMPPAGGFVSNLAQGGRAVARELDAKERATIEGLGKFLKHAGIALAGADLIGHYLSEVNITSPTGIRSIQHLEKRDISKQILAAAAGEKVTL